MSAFNSSSSLEQRTPSAEALSPYPPKPVQKPLEANQALLTELLNDMRTRNQYAGKLRSVVGYFASLFAMNALELTAWGYLLRLHFHPSDSLADLIAILQMTGFHIKSILSHKSVHYLPQLISEDLNFLENYTRWCNDYSLPTVLSLAHLVASEEKEKWFFSAAPQS